MLLSGGRLGCPVRVVTLAARAERASCLGNPDRAILYKAVNGAAVSSKSASPWGAKGACSLGLDSMAALE